MPLPGLRGIGGQVVGGAGPPPDVTYRDTATDSSGKTTYTFASLSIGPASADRLVVAGVLGHEQNNSASVSSVKIGGVAATEVKKAAAGDTSLALYQRLVTSGTTADVEVTFSASRLRAGAMVWSIVNLMSTTPTDTEEATGADPNTDVLDIQANGAAIAFAACDNGSTASWAGLTENDEATPEGSMRMTGASGEFASEQTARTIGPDWSGSSSDEAIAMAAWR